MTTENISSPEETQETAESLPAYSEQSTQKRCNDSSDCPPGCTCIDGECVPSQPEAE
jgi:hypothetical protein